MQIAVPLFTPRKEVSFGEKGRLASPTETGSMVSSLDSPASSIASYNVKVRRYMPHLYSSFHLISI